MQAAYAKSGKVRTVPMNRDVFAALEALRPIDPQPDAPVFRRRDGCPLRSIRTVFEKACRRAGLHRVRIHSLRHTFATRLVEASVDLRTVQDIGGWSSLSLIERYAHVAAQRKAEAVERLAESREISRQAQDALDGQSAKVLSFQARAASSAW